MLIARRSLAMLYHPSLRQLLIIAFACFVYACGGSESSNTNNNSNPNPNNPNPGNGTLLSGNSGFNPTIAASFVTDRVNVYVVWEEPSGLIIFRRSLDGGTTFDPLRRLFPIDPIGSQPVLAAVGENIYLVWAKTNQGRSEILFSVSHDAGQSFSLPVSVSEIGRTSVTPALTVSQSFVYVAWLDLDLGDILFRRSDPTGSGFDNNLVAHPILNLSNNNGTATSTANPSVSTANGNVYVAWNDSLPNNPSGNQVEDINFARSTDEGKSFDTPTNRSSNLTNSTHPIIAADDQDVYVVWEDFSSNNSSILAFQRSSDGGITFPNQNNREILLSGVTANGPKMVADGDNVFIAWDNPAPNPNPGQQGSLQIFFSKSDDQGNIFSIQPNISQNPNSAKSPAIAAAQGEAYVVWEGQFETSPQNFEQRIFFFKP